LGRSKQHTAIMPIGFLKKKLPILQSQTRPEFQSKEKLPAHIQAELQSTTGRLK